MKPPLFRMLILLVIVLVGTGRITQAATYTVTTLTDSASGTCTASACTISQALAAANATAADDLIAFAAGLRGEIAIADTLGVASATTGGRLTVQGRLDSDAQPEILLSGNTQRRVMYVSEGADVSLDSLGIVKGNARGGGGILNHGTLVIARSTVAINAAESVGGGIGNLGSLVITHSRLSGNQTRQGAGINNQHGGVLTITHSTLSDNRAYSVPLYDGLGGAIMNYGTLNLAHSTLNGNTASGQGGGISNHSGTVSVLHSTLVGNGASGGGAGGSESGGGIYNVATLTITASVVASSKPGRDCRNPAGTINASYSLIEDGLDCVNGNNTANLIGNPMLLPLQDNGGLTFTHLPQPDSPLIDAVACDLIPGFDNRTDQRDITRPQGARCEIGAVEHRLPAVLRVTVNGNGRVDAMPTPAVGPAIDNCRQDNSPCTATYIEGDAATVTLTATAAGQPFAGWSGACSGDAVEASVNMDADRACTATFAVRQHTVTFVDWNGTVLDIQTVNDGSAAVAPADPVRVGYTFIGWTPPFNNVTTDLTVTAQYMINQYLVSARVSGGHGSITPLTQTVSHGGIASLTVTPAAGYHAVEPLSGDCPAGVLAGTSYVTGAIVVACEVIAGFAQNVADTIAVHGGGAQSARVLAPFADALTVRVADAADVPLQGITVTFVAPGSGPSGVLSSPTATTDASGLASITAVANAIAGTYTVTASVGGVATPANFTFANTPFATTLTLTVAPATVPPGGVVTLIAALTSEGSLIPGGNVDFLVDGVAVCITVPVDATGIASCQAGPFTIGQHQASASYPGDDAHAAAVSEPGGIGFGVQTPVMVPMNNPWALALLIALSALFGTALAKREQR